VATMSKAQQAKHENEQSLPCVCGSSQSPAKVVFEETKIMGVLLGQLMAVLLFFIMGHI
jgi:hypothetical protein